MKCQHNLKHCFADEASLDNTKEYLLSIDDILELEKTLRKTTENLPENPAPSGIGGITLPIDADSIVALFGRLPTRIAGMERNPPRDRHGAQSIDVIFGESQTKLGSMVRFIATPLQSFEPPEGQTADKILAALTLDSGDHHGQTPSLAGRGGNIVWAQHSALGSSTFPRISISWADSESPWIFGVMADTPEHLDAGIAALIAAAIE